MNTSHHILLDLEADAMHAARNDPKPAPEPSSRLETEPEVPRHKRIEQAALTIIECFTWDKTPEGGNYWAVVHHRLMRIAQTVALDPSALRQ